MSQSAGQALLGIMPRTALFVIDIQVGMAQDLEHEVPHAARIREAGRAILQKARTAINSARLQHLDPSLGIIIVQHYEKDETELLVKGKREWELVFKPENETEKVVEKIDGKSRPDPFIPRVVRCLVCASWNCSRVLTLSG